MRVPGVVMHPLPGWGPPPCSPTPTADFLRLALSLLLLTALPCALGQPLCKEGEFQKGALCCPKCWPGYRVQEACGEFRGTMCVACTPGTYTAHLNGLPECLPCRVCDPGETRSPLGLASASGSSGPMFRLSLGCGRCSGQFAWEATPGTSSSDVTCSPWGPVIIILSVSVILVITVISVLVLMSIRDRRSRACEALAQGAPAPTRRPGP
ncbi:PREDICTED: tumor necrosis factor receptor superfamily member 14 [Myotis brandtii]|uniref:tumor necrosis factor receptor superfamily member 14 n=1 Tax=Myotis brandtii TaxID=109478 RepID=UPI00070453DF|nr:PREDICTED: tumor necrosis factor receptor superfamily member 14 [Myotis brandtii]